MAIKREHLQRNEEEKNKNKNDIPHALTPQIKQFKFNSQSRVSD